METNKNPYLRTHIAIIKALLDGSKKTQNQIAKETNYEKSTISHALDYLENKKKVIIREPIKKESGYTNKGNYNNKLCWLTYEVDNGKHILEFLREILKKETSLIPDLQKSDKIIGLIWDYFIRSGSETYDGWEAVALISSEIRDMFRLSPSFFKNFLINEYFLHSFNEIWKEVYGYIEETKREEKSDGVYITEYMFLDIGKLFLEAFNYSVINDFINGYGNPEALKLIRSLRENEFNRSGYETTQIEIDKTEDYPGELEN